MQKTLINDLYFIEIDYDPINKISIEIYSFLDGKITGFQTRSFERFRVKLIELGFSFQELITV